MKGGRWRRRGTVLALSAFLVLAGWAALRQTLDDPSSSVVKGQSRRALEFDKQARSLRAQGHAELARQELSRAVAEWALCLAPRPLDVDLRRHLVEDLLLLGAWQSEDERWEACESSLSRAVKACTMLPDSIMGDVRIARLRSHALEQHAQILELMGRIEEACEARQEAVQAARRLLQQDRSFALPMLIELEQSTAATAWAAGRLDVARTFLDQALVDLRVLGSIADLAERNLELAASVHEDAAKLSMGVPDQARALLERALELREREARRVVSAGPSAAPSPTAADHALAKLAAVELDLAHSLLATGSPRRSIELAFSAVAHQSRRLQLQAGDPGVRRDHALSQLLLARILQGAGQPRLALEYALPGARTLALLHAEDRLDQALRDLASQALQTLSALDLELGDYQATRRDVEQYLAIEPWGYEEAIESCRFLAEASRMAERDSRLKDSEQAGSADRLAERALDCLSLAIRRGFRDRDGLIREPAFAPLRSRPRFRSILAELDRLLVP